MLIPTPTPFPKNIAASASLYDGDIRRIEDAIIAGRRYAADIGERFSGASIDIDKDGFVYLHIAGVETIVL